MYESRHERRIVPESGLDARIAAIAEPVVEDLGYRLVRVRVTGLNGCTVQVMAERPDGTMTVADCELVSRDLSPALDVDDPIDRAYHLEVSSPGIDRPLVRRSDFERWRGHVAKIDMRIAVDGRKRFRGIIADIADDCLVLRLEDPKDGTPAEANLPLDHVGEARLVLTDALIEAALKAEKQAAKTEDTDDRQSAGRTDAMQGQR